MSRPRKSKRAVRSQALEVPREPAASSSASSVAHGATPSRQRLLPRLLPSEGCAAVARCGKCLIFLATPAGLEPATLGLGIRCSIR